MGLSIRALSNATSVVCDGNAAAGDNDGEACEHETVRSFPLGREGLKRGCYTAGKGGREFSFELNYGGYSKWFDELYALLYRVDAEGASQLFHRHRGKPFIEFVLATRRAQFARSAHPVGTLGPAAGAAGTVPGRARLAATGPRHAQRTTRRRG